MDKSDAVNWNNTKDTFTLHGSFGLFLKGPRTDVK